MPDVAVETMSGRRDDPKNQISDIYFRRLFVPVIITILVMCGVAVLIATPPGTPVKWNTGTSATQSIFNNFAT